VKRDLIKLRDSTEIERISEELDKAYEKKLRIYDYISGRFYFEKIRRTMNYKNNLSQKRSSVFKNIANKNS